MRVPDRTSRAGDTAGATHRWRRALLAAAAQAALIAAACSPHGGSDGDALVRSLAASQGATRPTEGRFAGGFPYAPPPPPPPVVRGPAAGAGHEEWRGGPGFARAAADVASASARSASPGVRRAQGLVLAFRGETDGAIAALEEARSAAPDDAATASDCAAAYLDRAGRLGTLRDCARALACADAALRADPRAREAMFNRGLALERLSLRVEARVQWQTLLGLETDRGWAGEARGHLSALLAPTAASAWEAARPALAAAALGGRAEEVAARASAAPAFALAYARDELPAAWAGALAAGRAEDADRSLRVAAAVAEAVSARTGDASARDVCAEIAGCGEAGRAELAEAFLAMARGRAHFGRREIGPARAQFERALVRFERTGAATAATLCRFEVGRCDVFALDYERGLGAMAAVREVASRRGYTHLYGRSLWVEGFVRSARLDAAAGFELLAEALRVLSATRDLEAVANVEGLLASLSDWFGDADAVWEHHGRALAAAADLGSRRQFTNTAGTLARELARDGEPEVALYMSDAALATPGGTAPDRAAGLCFRAVIRSRLGRADEAAADLASAKQVLAALDDEAARARVAAELALAEADVGLAADPEDAAARLSGVLETFEGSGDRVRTAEALGLRARAWELAGDFARAAEDYEACARELEAQRRAAPDERRRAAFLSRPDPVFDRAVNFAFYRLRDPAAALRFSEAHRARTLLDRLGPPGAVSAWLDGAAGIGPALASLPARGAVVEYALTSEGAIAWVCAGAEVRAVELPSSGPAIERLAAAFRAAVERGAQAEELARLGGPLHDALLGPVGPLIAGRSPVVLVPDEALRRLPFAALVDPASGRFVAEELELVSSPSLAVYAACVARAASTGAPETALVIGNPWFSRERYPGLAELREAEVEARQTAALYPRSELLTGRAATRGAVLSRAASSPVIHFAGHALSRPGGGTALVCAEESGPGRGAASADTIGADDIGALRLDRTRLVVLAACGTADKRAAGEDLTGLVRAFMAAGAPGVVASLWEADDRATGPLLVEFHRLLRGGLDPAAALAGAQRAMLRADDPGSREPKHWAAFALYGGFAAP